ncbi:hypothetical protein ACODG4_07960 [Vagococcus fluvialis]|uniref:hypothetical protein n=1 Tax=Vagococcus fluvialis TaxID=2738 RepID=UPI003B5BD8DA
MVVVGLFIMLGIAIMVVGVVWTILNKIKKQSIKKGLVSVVVGLVVIVIATVSTLFIGSDYQALNTVEGDKFAQLIQNGEDINNKTLTFTVADKGKDSPMGVGLSIPTSEGVLNVVLESNQDTQKIKKGDTITVRMDSMGNMLGIPLIQSRFVNYE